METNSLPPFFIGQKVVYITGIKMPKGSIHIVTELISQPCGCWLLGIDNVPLILRPVNQGCHTVFCDSCKKYTPASLWANDVHDGNGWETNSFRPAQEFKFPLMSFSKIVEKEKQEILINN